MKMIALILMLAASAYGQLIHRLDVRIDFTNVTQALNWYQAATNRYDDVADRLDPDGQHYSLRLVTNTGNYTLMGRLILQNSNKIYPIYSLLLTNNKPVLSSGFIEWHQCPREGYQRDMEWWGCAEDLRSFYRRFSWP